MRRALTAALLGLLPPADFELELAAARAGAGCRRDDLTALERDPIFRGLGAWAVADALRALGDDDCAQALVRFVPPSERNALAAYLRSDAPRARMELEALVEALSHSTPTEELRGLWEELRGGSPVQVVRFARAALSAGAPAPRAVHETGAAAAGQIGWHAAAAELLRAAGLLARGEPGGLPRAVELWSRAAAVEGQEAEAPRGLALSLRYLGNAQAESGLFAEAADSFHRALELYERHGALAEQAAVLHGLGLLEILRGRPKQARSYLESALQQGPSPGMRRTAILCDLSETYGTLGELDRAFELAREALAAAGNRTARERAIAHSALGLAAVRSGVPSRAHSEFERAVALFEASGDRNLEARARGNLALCLLELDRLDEAEETQRRALAIAEELDDVWLRAGCHFHLGRILCRAEKYAQAQQSNAALLRAAEALQSKRFLMRGLLNTAELHLARREYALASEAAQAAVDVTHDYLSGLAPEEDARARDYRLRMYQVALEAALGTGDVGAFFEAIERGRAGALIDSLPDRGELAGVAASSELAARREDAAQRELAARRQYQAVYATGNDEEVAAKLGALEEARSSLRSVVERIRGEARAGFDLVYQERSSLPDLQARLRDDEAFVSFAWLDPVAYALVVTRQAATVVPLGALDRLEQASEAFRTRADSTRGVPLSPGEPLGLATESSKELRRLLLDPLALPASVRRLYVSPDGSLAYVPLALAAPERELVYVPSATTYGLLAEHAPSPDRRVLALGDPTLPAPSRLTPLPGARAEVAAVGDAVLVGDDAHEAALKQRLREPWRSVHLACHALIDPDRPLDSALVLAPAEGSDGRLTALEVFELPLKTDLVVLSACETAVGKVYRAEGVVGFTRAFLSAGAPRVIVSLWKVDDAATQALMTRLYELWNPAAGQPMELAAALRSAQDHVRSQPRWSAPHYWAAWQLWGLAD